MSSLSQLQQTPVEQLIKVLFTYMKQYTNSIKHSFLAMNQFTDNLQNKVDGLLKSQQAQFVQSYKVHMSKVSQQLQQMNNKLKQYQQKIQYYENQGRLAQYVQRVRQLQLQVSGLYVVIENKDSKIKLLKQEIQMFKKMQKHSDQQIKLMLRKNIQLNDQKQSKLIQEKLGKQEEEISIVKSPKHNQLHMSSIETFATEIPVSPIYSSLNQQVGQNKNRFRKAMSTEQESMILQKSQILPIHTIDHGGSNNNLMLQQKIKSLQKQLSQIKKQNKQLLIQSNRYAMGLSDLGEIFWNSIEQTKKFINKNNVQKKLQSDMMRNRSHNKSIMSKELKGSAMALQTVTYQQFTKEDKLLLLVRLLENESVLTMLYEQMFNNVASNKHNMSKLNSINRHLHNRAQSVLQKTPKNYSHNNNESINNKNVNNNSFQYITRSHHSSSYKHQTLLKSVHIQKNNQSPLNDANKINFLPNIRNISMTNQ